MSCLEDKIAEYDFVRLTMPDINGHHISKLIPARYAKKIIRGDTRIYSGIIAFGTRNQVIEIPEVWERNFANVPMIPQPETFHDLPWASRTSGKRICEILCETVWINGDPIAAHPRTMARRQLDRLEKMGYMFYSAFEPEYRAFHKDSYRPLTSGQDMAKADLLCQYEKFFVELDTNLAKVGIEVQDLSNENGAAQLETPLMPRFGIEAADSYFVLKQAVREIARENDFTISFMSKPIPNDSSSGCHFNHSLWIKNGNAPAMYDQKSENGLSTIARHWIGGLMRHLPAILALTSPTVNCYRRLHHPLAPGMMNWCIDNRMVSIRVKNEGPKGTYVENRIPSSAANPYVVMAATIAAGIDGIENCIEPPPMGEKCTELGPLPKSLAEALDCLEADKAFVESLGSQFVDWYLRIRRGADLKDLADVDFSVENDATFEKEREQYFQYS